LCISLCGPQILKNLETPALDGNILLKFSLEIRLESKPFETLTDFLRVLVQKLWPKNNKLIDPLIRKLMNLLFLGHNSEPEMLESRSKAQKTQIRA